MFVFVDARIVMCSQCVYQGLIEILLSVFLNYILSYPFLSEKRTGMDFVDKHHFK